MFRPSVCNRLDRNTTGLLLMGKTLAGAQMLSEGCGNVPFINFTVPLYPGTLQNRYICRMAYQRRTYQSGKDSDTGTKKDAVRIETSYTSVQAKGTCSLLEICLITGKTHQIRAHLASVGHPVIGDRKYGDRQ